MGLKLKILALLTCCLVSKCGGQASTDDMELLMVHVLWRHGDRTPTETFDNDSKKWWREGWGQLTALGMRQQYTLGQVLAKRYIGKDKLLPNTTYNMRPIYVRSTDVDRTLMSAYSNLAGMFRPGDKGHTYPADEPWPDTWQPIPVHTVENHVDYLLNMKVECPTAEKATKERKASDEWLAETKKNQEFLKWLTKKAGAKHQLGIDDVWLYWDDYLVQTIHKEPTPDYNATVVETLRDLAYYDDNRYYLPEIVTRLRGGAVLAEIVRRMQDRVKCISAKVDECWMAKHEKELCCQMHSIKYYAYSAHDTTAMALLRTLHDVHSVLHDKGFPHYASCIVFELLHKKSTKQNFVKVLYQPGDNDLPNVTSDTGDYMAGFDLPFEIITNTVTGCPNDTVCELAAFAKRSEPFMPVDWWKECGYDDGKEQPAAECSNSEVWIIILSITAGILLITMLACCYVNRMQAMERKRMIVTTGHEKW